MQVFYSLCLSISIYIFIVAFLFHANDFLYMSTDLGSQVIFVNKGLVGPEHVTDVDSLT